MLTEILKSSLVFLLSLKDGFLVKISQNYQFPVFTFFTQAIET